jgi:flagellar L-ring protein precursor FlgH
MSMVKSLSLFFLCLVSLKAQDMRQNSSFSLFSDQKANRIGDAVTIIVIESSQASNNAQTNSGRTSKLGLTVAGTLGKNPLPGADISIGTDNQFTGNGATTTTGMIKTNISATIDSVLPNGNLVIKGSRKIVINGEEQVIRIKGIIRNSDINADNSILSTNISEAEIVFEGTGSINDSQHPGWITKFLHWIF